MPFYLRKQSKPNNIVLKIHHAKCLRIKDCDCYHLQNAKVVRYLGILIDEKPNWIPHILELNRKLRQIIHKLYILKEILNLTTLKLVYNALVQSRLQYAIVGTHIKSLNLTQKHNLY